MLHNVPVVRFPVPLVFIRMVLAKLVSGEYLWRQAQSESATCTSTVQVQYLAGRANFPSNILKLRLNKWRLYKPRILLLLSTVNGPWTNGHGCTNGIVSQD